MVIQIKEKSKGLEVIKGRIILKASHKRRIKMKPMSDLDYVVLYAEQLKKDNKLFEHQKRLVEDQIKASASLFRNAFGKDFKGGARKYLKETKIID